MGVAGCGKSSLATALADALALPLVEGDVHHGPANRAKMAAGVPLTEADRSTWLATLAAQLQARPQGVVLACSALRRSHRDLLRAATPGLRFLFLEIGRDEALARVQARVATHFFSPSLVDNQFATLEPPLAEALVLRLDAREPVVRLVQQVRAWLDGAELNRRETAPPEGAP